VDELLKEITLKGFIKKFRKPRLMAVGTHCADHVTPLGPQELALTSPTGGSRPVGIVCLQSKGQSFYLFMEICVACMTAEPMAFTKKL
jgi:hypothetical protein